MNGRRIQGIVTIGNAQETGSLLERLVAESGHFQQGLAIGEGAVVVAPGHDIFGQQRVQARYAGQQRRGSGIYIDAYCVHAVFDDRSEEHTSELQSLMRISYAVFCLKKKNHISYHANTYY